MLKAPTYDDILLAAENIREKSIRTPLVKLNWKTENDVNIYLKLENLQEIGSFKVRTDLTVTVTHSINDDPTFYGLIDISLNINRFELRATRLRR